MLPCAPQDCSTRQASPQCPTSTQVAAQAWHSLLPVLVSPKQPSTRLRTQTRSPPVCTPEQSAYCGAAGLHHGSGRWAPRVCAVKAVSVCACQTRQLAGESRYRYTSSRCFQVRYTVICTCSTARHMPALVERNLKTQWCIWWLPLCTCACLCVCHHSCVFAGPMLPSTVLPVSRNTSAYRLAHAVCGHLLSQAETHRHISATLMPPQPQQQPNPHTPAAAPAPQFTPRAAAHSASGPQLRVLHATQQGVHPQHSSQAQQTTQPQLHSQAQHTAPSHTTQPTGNRTQQQRSVSEQPVRVPAGQLGRRAPPGRLVALDSMGPAAALATLQVSVPLCVCVCACVRL